MPDFHAALLHLASTPCAQDLRKVLLMMVSTGIACRTIDQRTGEIPVDGCGLQGEISHLPATVMIGGMSAELRCDCGQPGHVAAFHPIIGGPWIGDLARRTRVRRSAPRTRSKSSP